MQYKEIQTILLDNEQIIIDNTQSYSMKKSAISRRSRFKALRHSGDLLSFVDAFSKSSNGKKMIVEIQKEGFVSYTDLIDKYRSQLDSNDITKLGSLIIGAKYDTIEISCLTKNFNIQRGMYSFYSNDNLAVVLKANTGGVSGIIHGRRSYDDRWLDEDKSSIRYCLQEESQENIHNFTFSKAENSIIFNGILNGNNVPIYLFARDDVGQLYTYYGKFYANSILEDNKSFRLVSSDSFNKERYRENRYLFLDKYRNTDFNKLSKQQHLLIETDIPRMSKEKNEIGFQMEMSDPFRNPDFLKIIETQKAVEEHGQKEVLEFEKNRVSRISEALVDKVKIVDDFTSGFSIVSFDDNVNQININVKTTTDVHGNNPFVLSMKEYLAMKNLKDKYYIYRVYDIHSTLPKFYKIRYPQSNNLDFYTKDFLCSLR